MTLTEFLLARIAEDEARAGDGDDLFGPVYVEGYGDWALLGGSRLRRECEAKRRIVARASRSVVTTGSNSPSPFGNLTFSEGRYYAADGRDVTDEFDAWHAVDGEPADPETLRDLASVYADHPDYREEWRP